MKSKRWPIVALFAAILCMVMSTGLGYLAHLVVSDTYPSNNRTVEIAWSHVARVVSVLILVSSAVALASISSASETLRHWCRRLLIAATLGTAALFLLGFAWLNEAEVRGGVWAGLSTLVSTAVGIVFPAVIGLLCGLQLLAFFRMRRDD